MRMLRNEIAVATGTPSRDSEAGTSISVQTLQAHQGYLEELKCSITSVSLPVLLYY